jgi:DNA mismatch endonuclease (patch repair protein)
MSGWKDALPPSRAWKRRAGSSPSREQDIAAGGRNKRLVDLGDGRSAIASVALKVYPNTRRIRAVLRWSQDGKSPERYLGEVEYSTRASNLADAWQRARAAGLLVEDATPANSWASSTKVRATMRGNRSRNTTPELALRSLLHRRGLRYRVDAPPLKGVRRRADIVFPKERVAVFVDGCFWHGCPTHYRPSTKNTSFWEAKLGANRTRDGQTNTTLASAGWTVIRAWEHENMQEVADRIEAAVRGARQTGKDGLATGSRQE